MSGDKKSNYYSIGHLAKKTGLTPRTIRYYEELGLLNSIKRIEGGRRVYTDDDLRRLKFIKRLKLLGLTLAEMKELEDIYQIHRTNKKVLPRLLELLDHHFEETDKRINGLIKLKGEIQGYKERIMKKLEEIQE
ncbi:MAG: MerR family transcriptional regulator [Deltaproteobacteria bacterium]|nr:MAG: MerR family transcriptional regulator [Deltaproteobacteria bacterium]